MSDDKKSGISRRDFLKAAAIASAVTVAAGCEKKGQAGAKPDPAPGPKAPDKVKTAISPKPTQTPDKARVVLVRDEAVLDSAGNVNPQVLSKMLDDGVVALQQADSAEQAWAELLQPTDTLGIKSNVWKFIPTPPELEEAIRQRAMAVGIDEKKIAIDDRGVLGNPVFKKATALINARTLRTHHWSGIGSCIKNYIMFHPEPWTWHDDSCADLAGLWALPNVKGKTRLNIQVALTPLFHGKGPHHFNADYVWSYKGLIMGFDPVAVDATAVRLLEAKRLLHFGKTQPFGVPPKHVKVAQDKHRLGIFDSERIELVKIGWAEDRLI